MEIIDLKRFDTGSQTRPLTDPTILHCKMSTQSNDSNMTEWDLLDERASLVDTGDAFPSGPTSTEAKDAPLAMHPALGGMHEDSINSQYGLFGQVIAAR